MEQILSTNMLEKYIYEKILIKMEPYINSSVVFEVIFSEGGMGCPDGIYVYSKNGKYFYLSIERGNIQEERETDQLTDIIYWSLEGYIFKLAVSYATKNRDKDKDFRRGLFQRELQIWLNIDKQLYERKQKDIDSILEINPYTD